MLALGHCERSPHPCLPKSHNSQKLALHNPRAMRKTSLPEAAQQRLVGPGFEALMFAELSGFLAPFPHSTQIPGVSISGAV